MHIAYVCADRGVRPGGSGGSSTHVRELVKALAARGARITVLAAAADGAAEALGVPVIDLMAAPGMAELRAAVQKAARTAGDEGRAPHESMALLLNQAIASALAGLQPRPDVVYERHSLWSTAGLHFARNHGIPHLLEVNAPLVSQEKEYRQLALAPAAEAIEEWLVTTSDRLLVTTPSLADWAHGRGASRRAVRVVPCGVPSALVAAGPRERVDPSRFTIGFVGSLKPWHGVDILLRAFRKLHRRELGYRLRIVGDGPMRGEIERWIGAHGLGGCTDVVGAVPPEAIPGELARMDAGVAPYPELPSFYFSPLKLWEYAGAGVPMAASAVGDLPRLFPHREAALLHPAGSASKLAEHLATLREDPALAQRLARRARMVAKAHTWDRIAARVERIAADAVARSARG
jgi:glycosyltransferase involved in cell wall biosynthesis